MKHLLNNCTCFRPVASPPFGSSEVQQTGWLMTSTTIAAMVNHRRRHLPLSTRMVEPQMMHKDHVLHSSLFGIFVSPLFRFCPEDAIKSNAIPPDRFAFINHREGGRKATG